MNEKPKPYNPLEDFVVSEMMGQVNELDRDIARLEKVFGNTGDGDILQKLHAKRDYRQELMSTVRTRIDREETAYAARLAKWKEDQAAEAEAKKAASSRSIDLDLLYAVLGSKHQSLAEEYGRKAAWERGHRRGPWDESEFQARISKLIGHIAEADQALSEAWNTIRSKTST